MITRERPLRSKDFENMEALNLNETEYRRRRRNGRQLIAGGLAVAAATATVAGLGVAMDHSPSYTIHQDGQKDRVEDPTTTTVDIHLEHSPGELPPTMIHGGKLGANAEG